VGNVAYVGTDGGQLPDLPATGCGSTQWAPLWQAQLSTTPAGSP
jgi:hypothetical protein